MQPVVFCVSFVFFLHSWSVLTSAHNVPADLLAPTAFQSSVTFKGLRFQFSKEALNQQEAQKKCQAVGATLIEPDNQDVSDFLRNLLSDTWERNTSIWTGLQLHNFTRAPFWLSGKPYNKTGYSNWAPSQPETSNGFCIQLWAQRDWAWDDTGCDSTLHFACQDKDPATFSKAEIESISSSILGLQIKSSIDLKTLSGMTNNVSLLLGVPSNNLTKNLAAPYNVIGAIDVITDLYNVSWQGDVMQNDVTFGIEIMDLSQQARDGNNATVSMGEAMDTNSAEASSAELTSELLREALGRTSLSTLQVNTVLYRKSSLFVQHGIPSSQSRFGEGRTRYISNQVLGHVISVHVKGALMENLASPVRTLHKLTVPGNLSGDIDLINGATSWDGQRKQVTRLKCVYWDYNAQRGSWSERGCRFVKGNLTAINGTASSGRFTCECDHMTNFAILLDISEFYQPVYLTYLTVIGCSVSIVCLVVTIFTYLRYKQLRSKLPQQILLHLCFSLVFLNVAFLVGIDKIRQSTFCFAVTVILHYLVLVTWAWMLTESVYLFRTLVLSKSGASSRRFIWMASIFCYGIPAGIVSGLANTIERPLYQSRRYCWLNVDPLLYSVAIPVGIVLAFNLITFLIIMYNITFRSKFFRQNVDIKRLSQAVRRALCMIFVLGLPWFFGFLMLLSKENNLKEIFAALFTAFNAFQGLFIFVLYCLRQEAVRNAWSKTLEKGFRGTSKMLSTRNNAMRRPRRNSNDERTVGTFETRAFEDRTATTHTILSTRTLEDWQTLPDCPPPPPPPPQPTPQPESKQKKFRSGWI